MRDVISEAVIAHKRWKVILDQAIETGTCKLSVETVKSDKKCTLGKWLNTLHDSNKKYSEIKEVHLKFHKCAARVLKLVLDGKKREALKATKPGSRYDTYSTKLVHMLMELHNQSVCI